MYATQTVVPPDRFRTFIRHLSCVVESGTNEQMLLSQCGDALARLVAHDDWLPADYQKPNLDCYQQHLLYCDPQERFSVVSFVWGPGQSTPIHNHGTWGVIGILRGIEISQSFREMGDGALDPAGPSMTLQRGQVDSFSPATGDIHQVRNGLDNEVSVSIHVYGTDIGSVSRITFSPDGVRKTFVSRYANHHLPNFWFSDDK